MKLKLIREERNEKIKRRKEGENIKGEEEI
jgi:hypothetical protein